jgi:hypothetical protein
MADDNRERRERLKNMLGNLVTDATYFAAGQRVEIKSSAPQAALDEALEYLIDNTFGKMAYITKFSDEPKRELQAILRANDIQKAAMAGANDRAMEEIRDFIGLSDRANHPVVLFEMIEKFGKRPYGWSDDEVLILVARLLVLGEIQLVTSGAPLAIDRVFENIIAPRKQRSITVVRRKMTDPKVLQECRNLGKDVFSEMGPDSEDGLFEFLRGKCREWQSCLSNYKALADTGNYPGQDKIAEGLSLIKALLAADEPAKFIERFMENRPALLGLSNEFHDIDNFYQHQKPTWEKLRDAYHGRFAPNRMELKYYEEADRAMLRMGEILTVKAPYGLLHEVDGLIVTVSEVNQQLLDASIEGASNFIQGLIREFKGEIEAAGLGDRAASLSAGPLEDIVDRVCMERSLAHIAQARMDAQGLFDRQMMKLEELANQPQPTNKPAVSTPVVKPRHIVQPAKLSKTAYLETRDEIDEFLAVLRRELEEAIARGERIQIR